MSELKVCSKCGEIARENTFPKCQMCGEDLSVLRTDPIAELRAELARRDEKIEELQFQLDSLCPCGSNPQDEHYLLVDEMCPIHGHPNHEIARRDEIIRRLKEDANRLAEYPHPFTDVAHIESGTYCHYCHKSYKVEHDDWCPITLHRALIAELEKETEK